MTTKRLEVRQLDASDTFKDIARIHQSHRGDIRTGTICKVNVGAKSRYLSIRGLPDSMLEVRRLSTESPDYILLDEVTRSDLDLKVGNQYEFAINPAKWWGRIWWAYSASDPAGNVSAFIATWSFVLAVISVLLGLLSLYLSSR